VKSEDARRAGGLRLHRDRFRRWDRRVASLVAVARHSRPAGRARQAIESLRHKRDRVSVKLELLSRSGDERARRELHNAWRELEEAWRVAIARLRQGGAAVPPSDHPPINPRRIQ